MNIIRFLKYRFDYLFRYARVGNSKAIQIARPIRTAIKADQGYIEVFEQVEQYASVIPTVGPALPEHDRCALGEGLFLAGDRVAWVDIITSVLYIHDSLGPRSFELPVAASVILAASPRRLLVASSMGFGSVDPITGKYSEETKFDARLCRESHRTNDGCQLSDGRYLLGMMHKSDPNNFAGTVFLVGADGKASCLCDDIHIPNTFIEMGNREVLVSDSNRGAIFRISFNEAGNLLGRSVWYQASGNGSPDGGCRLSDNHLAIAMWGGACVRIFDNSGKVLVDLAVPAKLPTNTAYDSERRVMWVSSASEGLTQLDLARYPLSGKTFSIEDPLALVCG